MLSSYSVGLQRMLLSLSGKVIRAVVGFSLAFGALELFDEVFLKQ
jgi:hypothetical protein